MYYADLRSETLTFPSFFDRACPHNNLVSGVWSAAEIEDTLRNLQLKAGEAWPDQFAMFRWGRARITMYRSRHG